MWDVKGVAGSDELTENNVLTLKAHSLLQKCCVLGSNTAKPFVAPAYNLINCYSDVIQWVSCIVGNKKKKEFDHCFLNCP